MVLLRLGRVLLKRLIMEKPWNSVMSGLRLLKLIIFWVRLRFWLKMQTVIGLVIRGILGLTVRPCWIVMCLLWKRLMGTLRVGVLLGWMLRNSWFLWLRRGLRMVWFTFLVIMANCRKLCISCTVLM